MADIPLAEAVSLLATFLTDVPLTTSIAQTEERLNGRSAQEATQVAHAAGISNELLAAALTVRQNLGRINDVIHAAAIVLALPKILDLDEQISNRPSLGAGNDPTRPFDLETDRRIAEFKLARWTGADAMRKRQVFKDLVQLATDTSGRQADLFVIGEEPGNFLRSSSASAAWALDRSPGLHQLFKDRFGPLTMTVASFTAGHARHVRITDLRGVLPPLAPSP